MERKDPPEKTITKQQTEATAAPREAHVASLSLAALQAHLEATLDGLSTDEAARRLTRYGSNELPE